MFNYPRRNISKLFLGLGVIATTQLSLVTSSLAQYQGHEGDIVVIGESQEEWSRFRSYWLNLLQVSTSAPDTSGETGETTTAAASGPSTEELEATLKQNLAVSGLKFKTIRGIRGSSQVIGTLTNNNKKSVTVASVSFEIIDKKGNLVQSGAATPQPSTLNPGQSVTFSKDFFGLSASPGHKVRLTQSPFVVRGGV